MSQTIDKTMNVTTAGNMTRPVIAKHPTYPKMIQEVVSEHQKG